MGLKGLTLLLASLTVYGQVSASVTPMVAFLCNKPAMYLSEDGWQLDRSTGCLNTSTDILNYCKKMYPHLKVNNIVEAGEMVSIDNWCGFDKTRCHKHNSHPAMPYRCLAGAFQSDALLVPEHCLFDHKHGQTCKSYSAWNATSAAACADRDMALHSFAILQPCKLNAFTGAEFVCCPKGKVISAPAHQPSQAFDVAIDPSSEEESAEDENAEKEDVSKEDPLSKEDEKSAEDEPKEVQPDTDEDFFAHYLQKSYDEGYLNEHQYFEKAKSNLQKHHHDQVTKMMKEWADARQRVQAMNVVDPKGADKLNKEVTARFQKTYEALEQEGLAEKKQLVALHQQRVQQDLNNRKRKAMQHYMDILNSPKADTSSILRALERYIKAEEKDRQHTINRYRHVADGDEKEAAAMLRPTLDHLHIIDQRLQQAVDMLNRQPQYQKKLRDMADKFLADFRDLDLEVEKLQAEAAERETQAAAEPRDNQVPAGDEQRTVKKIVVEDAPEQLEEDDDYYDEDYEDESEEDEEDEDYEEYEEKQMMPLPQEPAQAAPAQPGYDEEVDEDEHDLPAASNAAHAGADKLEVHVQQPGSMKQSVKAVNAVSQSSSYVFAVAVAGIAVFVILVIGIVVLRRKNTRAANTANHGFVEVDQAASPEERHVANMQMNGYENPTYKYFEMNTAANA